MAVKLLGRVTSINVRKVLWLLGEIGLPHEREDCGLPLRDPNVPEFVALNPNAQVPVLIEKDFVLWESNAIMAYLAHKYGALLPTEPHKRARVEQWLYWQLGELNPAWSYAVNALLRRNPAFADQGRIAESVSRWTKMLTILDGQLMNTPFVAGEVFTIADIAIGLPRTAGTRRRFRAACRSRRSRTTIAVCRRDLLRRRGSLRGRRSRLHPHPALRAAFQPFERSSHGLLA
jgi:glutathione S-transferase